VNRLFALTSSRLICAHLRTGGDANRGFLILPATNEPSDSQAIEAKTLERSIVSVYQMAPDSKNWYSPSNQSVRWLMRAGDAAIVSLVW